MVMRIGLFVLFVVGILRSAAESAGKLKQFIIRFGRMGAIYLLGWPLAVIFGELFLPNYMHKEVITVVEEVGLNSEKNLLDEHFFELVDLIVQLF